jgi:hypothetical protein
MSMRFRITESPFQRKALRPPTSDASDRFKIIGPLCGRMIGTYQLTNRNLFTRTAFPCVGIIRCDERFHHHDADTDLDVLDLSNDRYKRGLHGALTEAPKRCSALARNLEEKGEARMPNSGL